MIGHLRITCFFSMPKSLIMFPSVLISILVCQIYKFINHEYNIISPSSNVLDLGVYMSSNCTFDFHVANVYKRCSDLTGWIFRTFNSIETMMTLFKSIVLSQLDYASQLWSPHLLKSFYLIEKV